MTSPPNLTNITPPRVPLIDERTGLISREWYRFLLNLFFLTGSGQSVATLEDLQHTPDALAAVTGLQNSLDTLAQETLTQPAVTVDQWAELAKQVEALAQTVGSVDQWAELTKQVEALAQAPSNTPQLRNRAYGSFYDTTTQTAAAINTAYGMTFNTTDLTNSVYIGSPTSRVYVDKPGVYNIQFSAQLDNTSGGDHLAYIWLRVNGTDVANSAGETRIKGNAGELVAAWNYVQQFKQNDYFALMWSVSDTALQIRAQAATAPVPAIPSVILTVTDNISAYQD